MPIPPPPYTNVPYPLIEGVAPRTRDQIRRNFDEIGRYLGQNVNGLGAIGGPVLIATSATRPAKPYTGMVIFETDTLLLRYWNGTYWDESFSPQRGNNRGAFPSGSTTSTTYVDMPGPMDTTFTARGPSSGRPYNMMVSISTYATVATGNVFVGLNINGTDFDICQLFFNTLSQHQSFSGWRNLNIAGLTDGTNYTARLRWRVQSGVTGNVDSNDIFSVRIESST